jgi:hypothetical protein
VAINNSKQRLINDYHNKTWLSPLFWKGHQITKVWQCEKPASKLLSADRLPFSSMRKFILDSSLGIVQQQRLFGHRNRRN